MRLQPMPFRERLAQIAAECGPDACWNWPGFCFDGYGRAGANIDERGQRVWFSHRAAYTLLVGPVPDMLELDHLCRNRRCMNPRHLEPVTPRENMLRSDAPTAKNAAKTHCKNGHALTPGNVYFKKHPKYGTILRACRQCHIESGKRQSIARRKYPRGEAPHCAKGHPYTPENTIVRSDGRRRCRICDNMRRATWARADRATEEGKRKTREINRRQYLKNREARLAYQRDYKKRQKSSD